MTVCDLPGARWTALVTAPTSFFPEAARADSVAGASNRSLKSATGRPTPLPSSDSAIVPMSASGGAEGSARGTSVWTIRPTPTLPQAPVAWS